MRRGPVVAFLDVSPTGRPRIGVIVPRHGCRIVERNRLRRRLREVARREWLPLARQLDPAPDLLLRAQREAYRTPFPVLRERLRELFGQAVGPDHPAHRRSQWPGG